MCYSTIWNNQILKMLWLYICPLSWYKGPKIKTTLLLRPSVLLQTKLRELADDIQLLWTNYRLWASAQTALNLPSAVCFEQEGSRKQNRCRSKVRLIGIIGRYLCGLASPNGGLAEGWMLVLRKRIRKRVIRFRYSLAKQQSWLQHRLDLIFAILLIK